MNGGRLRVEAIGALRAFVDDEEIDLGPPKQRAVFAVLALCRGVAVSRLELVSHVWGDSAPATAAGSLHTYVCGLRRALGSAQDRLVSDQRGYRLRLDRAEFDAARAEDLAARARAERHLADYRRASAVWTSATLLTGVPGPFVDQARGRLAALRLQILIEYAEAALACPEPAALPELAGRLLDEVPAHPFDERLRTVLMRVLHRCGRTAEALSQFEELRRALSADLGIGPSPDTRAAFDEILADDRRPAADGPVRPAADGPVRPAQLPHDNAVFVGRADELLTVVNDAARSAESGRRIVMIVGVGGIGKTALAVRAGHMLRGSYPDGQVYLNLRGFDPAQAALTAEVALHQLLSSLGVRPVPSAHVERISLWRSLLADKRMLLVLDNAESADQVEDLLPGGSSCFVIVTSRNRLSGLAVRHAARRIPLRALSVEESLSLFGAMIGPDRVHAEAEAARRLADLCDRSPFALQIAAEQVVSTAGAHICDLVGQLENVQHRLDGLQLADDPLCSVRAVLSWSVEALDDEVGRAFRLLGVFPGTVVTGHVAAALFDTGLDQAGALLGTLSACCLIEQDGDQFLMHDLTRVYAEELSRTLEPAERREALSRVLSWYRLTLSNRTGSGFAARGMPIEEPRSVVPRIRFADQHDELHWCALQWQNIVALVRAANRTRQHGPAWHLTMLLFDYFYAAGQPLEWLGLLRVALRSAEALGNRQARAILLNHSSVAYSRLGQNETAVDRLTTGLDLLSEPGDWQHRISLLANLASTLREAKQYEAARGPAQEAIELAHREGIDYYLAVSYDVRCELNAETGRWTEAMRDGLPGLRYARRSGSQLLEANLLINIGLAHRGLGQQETAETTFGEALRISQDAGDRYHEGLALFGLARARQGGGAGVVGLARRALTRFEELHAEEAAEVRAFLAGLDG